MRLKTSRFAEYVCRFADEFFEDSTVRCWQEVPTDLPNVVLGAELRHNVFPAVKEGFMLPQHRKSAQKLIQTGHAVPLDDANREMRVELGLQEIPPTTHSSEKALAEVRTILRKTGFEETVGSEGVE